MFETRPRKGTMMNTNDVLGEQVEAAEDEFLETWIAGPSFLRLDEMPIQVGDPAPEAGLLDHTGEKVTLSSLWVDRPALLLFWRHFGCGCGIDRAERLREEYADYVAAGANVVVIGQGEPERAAAYKERYDIPCPILCDPGREVYRTYGLPEGTPAQILFDAPEEFWAHGHDIGVEFQGQRRDQGRPLVDNPWQLPGEFVIDSTGIIRLAYRYQYCEDFPNPLVHVTAIKMAS